MSSPVCVTMGCHPLRAKKEDDSSTFFKRMNTREYIERLLSAEEDKLPSDYVHQDLLVPSANILPDISYGQIQAQTHSPLPAKASEDSPCPLTMTDEELRERLLKAMAEKCNLREDQMANVLLQIQRLVAELPAEELRVFRRAYNSFV